MNIDTDSTIWDRAQPYIIRVLEEMGINPALISTRNITEDGYYKFILDENKNRMYDSDGASLRARTPWGKNRFVFYFLKPYLIAE